MEINFDFFLLILGFVLLVLTVTFLQNRIERKGRKVEAEKSARTLIRTKDSYILFYGVKIAIESTNYDEIELCAMNEDPRCKSAIKHGLDTFSCCFTEEQDCFLYLGKKLGDLCYTDSGHNEFTSDFLKDIEKEVRENLVAMDIEENPKLHMQIVCEY